MGVYTNTMRYTGTSGVDVESMVQALMKAEGTKADRLYKEKQKLEWTQQMFREMGTSVKTFNNNYLSFSSTSSIVNMRSTAAYSNKSVTGKFSGGDTISTGSSKNTLNLGGNSTIGTTSATAAGDYEITVNSVATGDTYTSGAKSTEVVSGNAVDVSTMSGPQFLDLTVNGSTKRISFTAEEIESIKTDPSGDSKTIFKDALQSKINTAFGTIDSKPKIAVDYDTDGKLVMKPNSAIGVTLTVNKPSGLVDVKPATTNESILDPSIYDSSTKKFTASGTDTYTINGKEIEVAYKQGQTKEDYVKSLNSAIQGNDELKGIATASLDAEGKIQIKKTTYDKDVTLDGVSRGPATREVVRVDADGNPEVDTDGNVIKDTVDVDPDLISGITIANPTSTSSKALFTELGFDPTANSSTFNVNQKIDPSLTGSLSQTIKVGSSNIAINIDANTTYKDVMNQVNSSGKASLTFNTNTNSFTLESKQLGENGKIDLSGATKVAESFGLDGASGGTYKKGTNAEVHVKGPNGLDQTLVRETNSFSYADINFKLDPNLQSKIDAAKEDSGDGLKIEMSITANTDQAFDNIKGFIDSYNTLIEQLSAATNTTRAKSGDYSYYEPLTEAEKEGMTDAQIEKLDNKAKQGLLYRNPELTRLQNKLREITTTEVTMADGSKMSLAKIGITTGDYSQGGKLFIDEDKLRGALENNSDNVAKLFTDSKNGVAEKVYSAINDAVGSEGYITKKVGFTDSIYSKNNYYSKQIEQKSKDLDRLNDYLISKENYYYSMFANMEKVITEANNQMASLSSY